MVEESNGDSEGVGDEYMLIDSLIGTIKGVSDKDSIKFIEGIKN